MGVILVNTNLAAGAGVIAALTVSRPLFGRIDLMVGLNGALAGLVAITAAPDFASPHWLAVVIGAIGGIVSSLGNKMLEKLKIDDVVGAVPGASVRRDLGDAGGVHNGGQHRGHRAAAAGAGGGHSGDRGVCVRGVLRAVEAVCGGSVSGRFGCRSRWSAWGRTRRSWGWKPIPSLC